MANILIIKLGALGDVVMATPLIEAIMAHHPNERCTLLTTPAFADLFEAWPTLQVEAIPRRGAAAMLRMLRFIRGGEFKRIYDLQSNDRSALLCLLSGVAERVGNHPKRFYSHHPAVPWSGQSHIFERMCEVLASGGVSITNPQVSLPSSARTRELIDRWLTEQRTGERPLALLHAGASAARPEKRWPGFAALAERLVERGMAVVWLGGEADRELNKSLSLAHGIDATNHFSISALAELGRRASFAVTNDSGPMHVLSGSQIPVFGLFGPSDWRRNHAVGQSSRVIACVEIDPQCAGQRVGDCLAKVTVDTVWQRLAAEGLV